VQAADSLGARSTVSFLLKVIGRRVPR
jgi:hypothetical protein